MTKDETRELLRRSLQPRKKVYTVIRHVTRRARSVHVDLLAPAAPPVDFLFLTRAVAELLDCTTAKDGTIVYPGKPCFLVEQLSRELYGGALAIQHQEL